LLEPGGQGAEFGNGLLHLLPHLLVLQRLVVRHIIGQLPVEEEGEVESGGKKDLKKKHSYNLPCLLYSPILPLAVSIGHY